MKASSIICVLLLSKTMPLETKQNWILTKNKEGISTYVSSTEGSNPPTKSEMIVNVSTKKVVNAIVNIESYPKWVPYCKKSYCIEKVSDSVKYCYQLISAPMIKDRDVVSRMTTRKVDDSTYQITFTSFPNYIDKKNGVIRIERLNTIYIIKALENGKTKIIQENSVSLGGEIPEFLINWANKNQPYETFKNLRDNIIQL